MSLAIPEGTTFGRVRARFITGVADTPDDIDDLPDFHVLQGNVTFTAEVRQPLSVNDEDILVPAPVTVTLDPDGRLDEYLISSDIGGWTWRATFELVGVSIRPYSFQVPAGADLWLGKLIPVASAPGTLTIQGPPGESAYATAVRNGFLGTEPAWLDSLVGPALELSSNVVTLAGPTNTISDITATLSEWTVTAPTTLSLPASYPAGGQHTVHVVSGYQHISWPGGTTVYGSTAADDVWLTLIRTTDGWTILVPDATPEAERDTGWITIAEGVVEGAGGVTYTTGPANFYAVGTPMPSPWPEFDWPFKAAIRRVGNRVMLTLPGSVPNAGHVSLNLADVQVFMSSGFYGCLIPGPFGEDQSPRGVFSSVRTMDIADGYDSISFEIPVEYTRSVAVYATSPDTTVVDGVMEWTTADPWPEGL